MPASRVSLLLALCSVCLLQLACGAATPPIECLYVARQADHQVVVYRDVPNPKHPPKLKLEAGTDVAAFSTHYLPTGITVVGDTIYVASYGNKQIRRKVWLICLFTFCGGWSDRRIPFGAMRAGKGENELRSGE